MLLKAAISPIFQPMILAPSGNEGLFIYLFLFILSLMSTITEQILLAIEK